MESFGKYFQRIRRLKGFRSAKALAEKSGASESLIKALEAGRTTPRTDNIQKLATALGLGITDLLEQKEPIVETKTADPKEIERLQRLNRALQTRIEVLEEQIVPEIFVTALKKAHPMEIEAACVALGIIDVESVIEELKTDTA